MSEPKDTLILCTKERAHGGYALWWGPDRKGYYVDIGRAGRYTRAEAETICHGIEAVPVPEAEALGMSITVADYPAPPRPKCAFKDCNNPVMRGPITGAILGVCQECFDRNRAWELACELGGK